MDAMLYEDALEASNESTEEGNDSNNEVDSKSKPLEEENEEYEINSLIDFNKINVIDIADEADEWVIDENIKFSYVPAVSSDSIPSCTSTEIDSLPALEMLTTFYLSIRSSLLFWSKITGEQGVVFEVPSQQPDKKPIEFGRVMTKSDKNQNSESNEQTLLQFYHYEQKS